MIRKIIMSPRALNDLDRYYLRASKQAPRTAKIWISRFKRSIASLEKSAERCSIALESRYVSFEVRQLRFGKRTGAFRVLFSLTPAEVHVLHIRLASQGRAKRREIED